MEESKKPISFFLIMRIIIPYALCYFIVLLYRNVNAIFSDQIIPEFNISASNLGLMTSLSLFFLAIFQVPTAILISHYGSKIIQLSHCFLLGIGMWVFSKAHSVMELSIGRALIGLGSVTVLNAGMKAVHFKLPKRFHPSINSIIQSVGMMGVVVGTIPTKIAMEANGWRHIAFIFSIVGLIVYFTLFMAPSFKDNSENKKPKNPLQLSEFFSYGNVFKNQLFWKCSIPSGICFGGFVTLQSLWITPWLKGGLGFSDTESANYLFIISIVMVIGALMIPFYVYLAKRKNIGMQKLQHILYSVYTVALFLCSISSLATSVVVWILLGLFAQAVYLNFLINSEIFDSDNFAKGTAVCAAIIFFISSVIQYTLGIIINMWEKGANGYYPSSAYQAALWFLCAISALSIIGSATLKVPRTQQ